MHLDHLNYGLIGASVSFFAKAAEIKGISGSSENHRRLVEIAQVIGSIATATFAHSLIKGKVPFNLEVCYSALSLGATIGKGALLNPQVKKQLKDGSLPFFCNSVFKLIDLIAFAGTAIGCLSQKKRLNAWALTLGFQLLYQIAHTWIATFYIDFSPSTYCEIEEMKGEEDIHYERREAEIHSLLTLASVDSDWNNILLIGSPGCGKTTLIKYIATLIKKGEVPDSLKGSRIFNIPASKFTSGCSYIGMVEERIDSVMAHLKEVKKTLIQGKVIVFIDEIWQLIGAGQGTHSTTDVAGHFLNLMDDPNLVFIGATTPYEFDNYIEERSQAFCDRFYHLNIPELSLEDKIRVAQHCVAKHQRSGEEIPEEVLRSAIEDGRLGISRDGETTTSCRSMTQKIPVILAFMNAEKEGNLKERFEKAICRVSNFSQRGL